MQIQNILVPVDFSERSEHAAQHASALAQRFGAQLVAAHVVPPSPYEYAAFDEGFYAAASWPQGEDVRQTLGRRLDEFARRTVADKNVLTIVTAGDPAHQIEELIRAHKIDLLVMPTHGYGPFRKLVLGSVTSKVLHDITIPVFTGAHVPEIAPIDPEPYKRIACAVDLKEHSEDVLRWAWDFAKAWEEDLIVIHAAPQIEVGGTYGDWFPPDTREQIEAAARKRVDELIAKVGVPKAEVHVASSPPVAFVRECLKSSYADVVVIGRSTHDGVLSGLLADAYALIRESPCPVISV